MWVAPRVDIHVSFIDDSVYNLRSNVTKRGTEFDNMPGNKNSGRKKKPVTVSNDNNINFKVAKQRGRPKNPASHDVPDEAAEPDTGTVVEDEPTAEKKAAKFQTQPAALNIRGSDMNKFYDNHLGAPVERFPPTKLPLKRVVLQRYRALLTKTHNASQQSVVKTISSELFDLWEKSSIPFKSKIDCDHVVRTLITKWKNARSDEKTSTDFQRDLDKLLDLRTTECMNLNSLMASLKTRKTGKESWESDYLFFKGQLTFPQTSSMAGKDKVLEKKLEEKSAKIAKRELFNDTNKGDFHLEPQDTEKAGCSRSSTSSISAISTENILQPSEKRKKKTVESIECHSVDEDSADSQVVSRLHCYYLS